MVYTKNIAIVSSFICLWLASLLNKDLETLLGFILILSFGILHGSNDILIFESLSYLKAKQSKLVMLAVYVGIVIFIFILFSILPLFALAVFIVFSAYHFGEQHWEQLKFEGHRFLKSLFYTSYGLFILFLLFIFNTQDVIEIIETISNYRLEPNLIQALFYGICVLLGLSTVLVTLKNRNIIQNAITEILYLLVLSVIFKISSLIWGFAIYFIFWHSLPSLYDQVNFIYKKFDKNSLLAYTKNAAPYWLISVVAIVVFYYVFNEIDIFYALFFSFLAAVTFPHSVTINTMFKKINKKN